MPETSKLSTPHNFLDPYCTREEHRKLLYLVYVRLGIDHNFEGLLDLTKAILALIDDTPGNLPHIDDLEKIQHALLTLKQNLIDKNYPTLAPTRRGSNPLGNQFKENHIAACLLQPADSAIYEKLQGLQLLLLSHLLGNPDENQSYLDSIADEIRLSSKLHSPRRKVLAQMPAYQDLSWSTYIERLAIILNKLPSNLDSNQRKFITAIRSLLTTHEKREKVSKPDVSYPPSTKPTPTIPDDDNAFIIPGEIISEPPPIPDTYLEPPDNTLLYQENNDASPDEEPTSDEGLNERAKLSSYWLIRSSSLTPIDSMLLNPIERRQLRYLLSEALRSPNTDDYRPALLLALLYATGLKIEELITSAFGEGGMFTQDGYYNRICLLPDDAYKPGEDAKKVMAPSFDSIDLPLPGLIIDALTTLKASTSNAKTLGQLLNLTADTASDKVKQLLESWREHGRYRFKLQKITAALGAECKATLRNPVLTFLLTGNDKHKPPTLHYYQAPTPEQLVSAYRTISNNLFSQ